LAQKDFSQEELRFIGRLVKGSLLKEINLKSFIDNKENIKDLKGLIKKIDKLTI